MGKFIITVYNVSKKTKNYAGPKYYNTIKLFQIKTIMDTLGFPLNQTISEPRRNLFNLVFQSQRRGERVHQTGEHKERRTDFGEKKVQERGRERVFLL